MAHTAGNIVVEYHEHWGVRTAVDGNTVLMVCQHVYLDGTECGHQWDAQRVHRPGAGSRLTTAEAVRAHVAKMVDAAAYGDEPMRKHERIPGTVDGIRPHRYPRNAQEAEQARQIALSAPPMGFSAAVGYLPQLTHHAPEVAGPDGLGYGNCKVCRQPWPCETWREQPVTP